jgi:hypothetical protein
MVSLWGFRSIGVPMKLSQLAFVQGAYFALTGLWGLFHYRSFQAVTGPKVDVWLVKTVSVLVTAIGAALILDRRRADSPGIVSMAMGSAFGLAGVDVYYAAKGRISKIYLLDALAELLLVGGWVSALRARAAR